MADTPKWFDYEFYMSAILAQLQAAEPANDWTVAKLVDAFAQNGFMGEEGAYVHFVQYGAAEEVAPNADFNASAKYLVKLQGVNINWYTRGSHNLSDARMRSIEVFHDWAVSEGLLK